MDRFERVGSFFALSFGLTFASFSQIIEPFGKKHMVTCGSMYKSETGHVNAGTSLPAVQSLGVVYDENDRPWLEEFIKRGADCFVGLVESGIKKVGAALFRFPPSSQVVFSSITSSSTRNTRSSRIEIAISVHSLSLMVLFGWYVNVSHRLFVCIHTFRFSGK